MCATCGCSTGHDHDHDHGHDHDHAHGHAPRIVKIEREILAGNDLVAAKNRGWLDGRGIFAVNVVGGPGAGKTALLERVVREIPSTVIEGDQETRRDADRIEQAGAKVAQINTGSGCHLDARQVAGALEALAPAPRSLVVVENVGNLVCPALFDLGEAARVVVLSVAEGDDKPIKYPPIFRAADAVVLNKIDLLPYVDFDVERCRGFLRALAPRARLFELSAKTGDGVPAFVGWLRDGLARVGEARA